MFKNISIKKKAIIIIAIIIFIIIFIFIFNVVKTNIIHNRYQNKLFKYENASLFFLEPWEAKDVSQLEESEIGEIVYIDEEYIYKFRFMDNSAATGSVTEYKTTYRFDGDLIVFEFEEGKYQAEASGEALIITLLETTEESDAYLGNAIGVEEYYDALEGYDYFQLLDAYKTNLNISLDNYRLAVAQEIGNKIGTNLYSQKYANSDFGFQYSAQNSEHPFTIIEDGDVIDDLVVLSARKVSDTTFTLALAQTMEDESIFSLFLDMSTYQIEVSFDRMLVPTNEAYYNNFGIYEIPLTFSYNVDKQAIVENENNMEDEQNDSAGIEQDTSVDDFEDDNDNRVDVSDGNNSDNTSDDNDESVNEQDLLQEALSQVTINLEPVNESYFKVSLSGKDNKYNYKIIYDGEAFTSNSIGVPYKGYGETCYEFEIVIDNQVSKTINKCITLNREKLDYQVTAHPMTGMGQCRVSIKTNNTSSYNQLNQTTCSVDGSSYGTCEGITGFFVNGGTHSITITSDYDEQTINFVCEP